MGNVVRREQSLSTDLAGFLLKLDSCQDGQRSPARIWSRRDLCRPHFPNLIKGTTMPVQPTHGAILKWNQSKSNTQINPMWWWGAGGCCYKAGLPTLNRTYNLESPPCTSVQVAHSSSSLSTPLHPWYWIHSAAVSGLEEEGGADGEGSIDLGVGSGSNL